MVASLMLPLQKLIAKVATFNLNELSSLLSAHRNPTFKLQNTTSSRNLTASAITKIAAQFLERALISSSPMLVMPTWTHTQTCLIHTTEPMQTTPHFLEITISPFKIMKFSLWDENLWKIYYAIQQRNLFHRSKKRTFSAIKF